MPIAIRQEWVGHGAKRLGSITPPKYATPPVAGYTSWYDGDDLAAFTLAGGSGVSQWNDKGSGGNHLTPLDDIHAPCLARHPTLLRGRLAVRFLGPMTVQGSVLSSSATASDRTQTAFVVGVLESLTADNTLLGCSADGGNRFTFSDTTGALRTDKADVVGIGGESTATIAVGTAFLAVQVLSDTAVTHILNGVSKTDSDSTVFTGSRTLQVGNSRTIASGNAALTGWIGEILIYDSTLSAGDISSVSAWLTSKWGV